MWKRARCRVAATALTVARKPGLLLLLDGAKLVTALAVAGGKAVRRHRDFLVAELFGDFALGRLRRFQRLKALLFKISR